MDGFQKEKASLRLFWACFLMYLIVCMMKNNYTASIAFLVSEGIFTKTDSGLISASFYLIYGLAQLLGSSLADRFSPYKVVTAGLLGAVVTNLYLCFTTDFWPVLIVWSLCGLAQFGIWPAICKMIAGVLIPEHRQKAGVYMVLCIGIGGILSYLLTPPLMQAGGWVGVFLFNTLSVAAVLVFWHLTEQKTRFLMTEKPSAVRKATASPKGFWPMVFASGLVFLLGVEVLTNLLNIGLKSWVPTMMVESYGISPTWANLQTMLIYISNLVGTFLLVRVIDRMKNAVWAKGALIALCLPLYTVVLFIGRVPQWSVILSFIIATTIIYSTGNINIRVSNAFEPYGYSATVSGLINAMACFGVVLANGGFGMIADRLGWNAVTLILLFCCVLAVCLCVPAAFLWKQFKSQN